MSASSLTIIRQHVISKAILRRFCEPGPGNVGLQLMRHDLLNQDDARPGPARDPHPPQHPPACCAQQTITVPPQVAAKTRQKHDYPSAAWRRSYRRCTGAERTFSTIKDTASTNIARGWCRLMGLTPPYIWLACLLAVRNHRILATWNVRQAENDRHTAAGLPPKTRKRRRTTPATLTPAPP